MWLNSVTLWTHALEVDPENAAAHNNLAVALVDDRRAEDAAPHLRRAIQIDPDYVDAYINYGAVLASEGRLPEAIEQWKAALRIDSELESVRGDIRRAEQMIQSN
jgi:tetratricopeptide (TPR) repeat protein